MNFPQIKETLFEYDSNIFRYYLTPYRNTIESILMVGAFLVPITWFIFGLIINDGLI
ncbi:hypothetical protein KC711_06415 [Candidatus Peregrinibacteria bacterium]|nr:hypothetical protein [Candidatus Peregrinibacteria bacterium]